MGAKLSSSSINHSGMKEVPVSNLEFPVDELEEFNKFHQPCRMNFNMHLQKTVDHLWSFIQARGSKIYIGFEFYYHDISESLSAEYAVISAIEFGESIVHTEVYFGDHVCRMITGDNGIQMMESPSPYHKIWELVCLPFNDPQKAFHIGVDITQKGAPIHFHYHPMQMVEHFIGRLFIPGHGDLDIMMGKGPNYDETDPTTWVNGVHCSELVLLFLKRCVREEALQIPLEHRRRFLSINTATCLPSCLRKLLHEIWPTAKSELRDYMADPHPWI
jgi:hypothetical protein